MSTLTQDYEKAMKAYIKTAAELSAALDKLEVARNDGDPHEITLACTYCQKVDKQCAAAYNVAEAARRAYWVDRTASAVRELESLAMPLLGAIHYAKSAACMIDNPGRNVLSRLGCATIQTALIDDASAVSIVPIECNELDRAEDSNIALYRFNATEMYRPSPGVKVAINWPGR